MSITKAVIEIAGGDSFAAAAAYASEARPAEIVPTYVHTGTEYGDFSIIERHVSLLRDDLKSRFGTVVAPLEISFEPELWRSLNGRYMTLTRERFGYFSPCIGCHLYLHLMRLPIAARENARVIVAGEREAHASGVKINQTAALLDAYSEIIASAGFELIMPVRTARTREELLAAAPWLWEEGGEQMKCVLSGNYRDAKGKPMLPGASVEAEYIKNFLIPAGKALAKTILAGGSDYDAVISGILEAL